MAELKTQRAAKVIVYYTAPIGSRPSELFYNVSLAFNGGLAVITEENGPQHFIPIHAIQAITLHHKPN